MKKIILSVATILILGGSTFAQSPESFKYQAVVRDASSNIINTQDVGMQFTILQGSATGTAVYSETFLTSTNAYGLVNIEIGDGTSTDDFSAIDWSNGPYFIETAIDLNGGTDYSIMGTSQLMSVPYALHAKTAESVSNDQVDDADNDPTNELQNWSDLPGIPANIDTDATDDFDGNYANLTGAPTNVSDFTNDAGYVTTSNDADNDATNELQNWSNLPGIPTNIDTDATDDFDGNYSSLTGAPTTVSSFTNDAGYVTTSNDADNDATNEIQNISFNASTNNLSIGSGNTVSLNRNCAFSAYLSVDVSLSGANILIPFQTEDFDLGGDYDPSTGTFTAPTDGVYQFNVGSYKNEAGNSKHAIQVYKNGAWDHTMEMWVSSVSTSNVRNGTFIIQLDAGETIQIYFYQNTGSLALAARNNMFSGYRIQ